VWNPAFNASDHEKKRAVSGFYQKLKRRVRVETGTDNEAYDTVVKPTPKLTFLLGYVSR
jgi:hypothetical protein